MGIKILVLTWNTQSIRLAETLDQSKIDNNRTGVFNIPYATTYQFSAAKPDFFLELASKFEGHDLIVFGFQEDAKPGSYFHSDFLPQNMPTYGYSLIHRENLIGAGKTTKDNLPGDIRARGLRLSIYCKDSVKHLITRVESSKHLCTWKDTIVRGKGSLAIYLSIKEYGTIGLVNVHLPHDAKSLVEAVQSGDHIIRRNALMRQYEHYNQVYSRLIKDRCQSVILFGDMNFRIDGSRLYKSSSLIDTAERIVKDPSVYFSDFDELRQGFKYNLIYPLDEGIDNKGVEFAPTCKLRRNRPGIINREIYNLGKHGQRLPSWCDRILYDNVKCLLYDRFESGLTMKQSDHCGVIGSFEMIAQSDINDSSSSSNS